MKKYENDNRFVILSTKGVNPYLSHFWKVNSIQYYIKFLYLYNKTFVKINSGKCEPYESLKHNYRISPKNTSIKTYNVFFWPKRSIFFATIIYFHYWLLFSGWRVLEGFNYERNTQVHWSCSTVVMGKMWIFGGDWVHRRQWSSVGKCGLKSEGTLPFDLKWGAANTVDGFNGAQSALLCFGAWPFTACHS